MSILFNEDPVISYTYNLEDYKQEIDQGYASAIKMDGNKSVLIFKDVDDHHDGNGLAILWLIEGKGTFYLDYEPIEMKKGDVLIFDDNIEHGFQSDEICLGMNITLDKEYSLDEIKSIIKNANSNGRKIKP